MTKQMVSAKVEEFDRYSLDGASLDRAIGVLQAMKALYGGAANIDIHTYREYDYSGVDVNIVYQREETDAEYTARSQQLTSLKEQEKARKLKLLEELKKEFGE